MSQTYAANDFEAIRRRMEELREAGKSEPTTLYDACRLVGGDNAGSRCPKCRLAVRCLDDTHWVVKKAM
jgi:hypothetical protein